MAGNTSDKTTLAGFLKKIEKQYGKAHRTWVMDRGIPTEETSLVILDTGPLVALINRADNFHAWAKAQFGTIHPSVITCEAVIAESWFLLRHLPAGQQALLRLVHQGLIDIQFSLAQELPEIVKLTARYANVPMPLADACL
jgi:uncharacterized protein